MFVELEPGIFVGLELGIVGIAVVVVGFVVFVGLGVELVLELGSGQRLGPRWRSSRILGIDGCRQAGSCRISSVGFDRRIECRGPS